MSDTSDHMVAVAAELTGLTGDEWVGGVNENGNPFVTGPDGLVWIGSRDHRGRWSVWGDLSQDQVPGGDRVSHAIWVDHIAGRYTKDDAAAFETVSKTPRYMAREIAKRVDEHREAVTRLAAEVDTWLRDHEDTRRRVDEIKHAGGRTVTVKETYGRFEVTIRDRFDGNNLSLRPMSRGWSLGGGQRLTHEVLVMIATAAKTYDNKTKGTTL